MTTSQLISKLNTIEATARLLAKEAITTRKELERINAPAPRKGRKRGGLTEEERAQLQIKIARRNANRGKGNKRAASSN